MANLTDREILEKLFSEEPPEKEFHIQDLVGKTLAEYRPVMNPGIKEKAGRFLHIWMCLYFQTAQYLQGRG